MKIKLLILFAVLAFILIGIRVEAVECNADLSNGGNNCTISSSLTLNGSYVVNMNGTSTTGAININANNLTFDCNKTNIYGNWSNSGNNGYIGIYINTKQNITIQNCNLTNFNYGSRSRLANNSFIINSTFTNNRMGIYVDLNNTNMTYDNNIYNNNTYAGVWFQAYSSSYLNITNSIFYSYTDGIREETTNSQVNNVNIISNIFYNNITSSARPAILQIGGSSWTIKNNKVYGSGALSSYGIDLRGSIDISSNNYIRNTQYGLSCSKCSNFTMINNTIDYCDENLFQDGNFLYIYNNTFRNMTLNVDGYNLGMNVYNSSNVIVSGNNFTEIATAGINSQGSINVTAKNNFFDFIPLSSRSLYSANDGNEPRCAIQFLIYYKGFIPTEIQINGNDNVSVTGNVFDSDTPCLLRTENITNLNTDLTSYKSGISFIAPTLFSGLREWYLPSGWTTLSRYSPIQGIRYDFKSNFGANTLYINYSMTSNYLYLQNENQTTTLNASFPSLTSALLTNGTGLCNGSSSNLASNSQVNITLNSNDYCYVLDNFKLTEGVSRPYSPLWFSGSSETQKKIASNLTQSINATIVFNVRDCNIGSISYISNSTNKNYNPSYTCSNSVVTINSLQEIERATGSNYITISYTYNVNLAPTCNNVIPSLDKFSSFFVIFFVLIGLVITITIVGFVLFIFNQSSGDGGLFEGGLSVPDIDFKLIGVFIIAIFVIIILLVVAVLVVSNLCLI